MKSSPGKAPPASGENLVAAGLPFFLRNFWHLSSLSVNLIKKSDYSLFFVLMKARTRCFQEPLEIGKYPQTEKE
jgi:hypothetical protein